MLMMVTSYSAEGPFSQFRFESRQCVWGMTKTTVHTGNFFFFLRFAALILFAHFIRTNLDLASLPPSLSDYFMGITHTKQFTPFVIYMRCRR